jgi:hypothetical protein
MDQGDYFSVLMDQQGDYFSKRNNNVNKRNVIEK